MSILCINCRLRAFLQLRRSHVFRATIFTEYSVLKELQVALGNVNFPYNHYRAAWYSFVRLLKINCEEGFMCQKCGNAPQAVIMDATSLAFRKELDSWQPVFSKVPAKTKVTSRR